MRQTNIRSRIDWESALLPKDDGKILLPVQLFQWCEML